MSTPGSSLAKFAFNIYGTLNNSPTSTAASSLSTAPPEPAAVRFTSDRDILALLQLHFPIHHHLQSLLNHVVLGGKNCLRMLLLNADQTKIVNEVNLLDAGGGRKLSSVNTIKTKHDTIACGLLSGAISVYRLHNNGASRLVHRVGGHARTVNLLDFLNAAAAEDTAQFILGLQDGTIKLWDLRALAARPAATMASGAHRDPIRLCQYSPHRSRVTVLLVHDLGAMYRFDLRGGHDDGGSSGGGGSGAIAPDRKWNFHTGPALSLHIHPERDYVATAGRDHKLCVWNYESARQTPEVVVGLHGPILKVRWSPYRDERTADPLCQYDLACTYLNEDPTISVFNLRRRFIPRETVTASRPFQNFIWGRHPKRTRHLWTVTKANQFASYALDAAAPGVRRPLEDLASVLVAWGGGGGGAWGEVTVVSEERGQFEAPPAPGPVAVGDDDVEEESPWPLGASPGRPPLLRAPTQESVRLCALPHLKQVAASPYLVPVGLPVQLSDEHAFEVLSAHYCVSIPDGFRLAEVCDLNADVAASVSRMRDSQVWRVLAVSLEQAERAQPWEAEGATAGAAAPSRGLLLLGLENFVGSFNLNLTLAQYGEAGTSPEKRLTRNGSGNLMEMINSLRGAFPISVSPAGASSVRHAEAAEGEAPQAVKVPPATGEVAAAAATGEAAAAEDQAAAAAATGEVAAAAATGEAAAAAATGEAAAVSAAPPLRKHTSLPAIAPRDLDDENSNVLSAAGYGTSASSGRSLAGSPTFFAGSLGSRRSSHIGARPSVAKQSFSSLLRVAETPEVLLPRQLQLTRAMHAQPPIDAAVPWLTRHLVEQALEYAALQGDVLMCLTLVLLFYTRVVRDGAVTTAQCLEWLGLYVETLRRKRLAVTAMHVVKEAPAELQAELSRVFGGGTALRFFCSWCHRLLVNEASKQRADFGYWYCDECRRQQPGCVYCHEPCRGINVVVSLRCGHRGHYGCLRTWFVEEQNAECPGGCDVAV